MKRDYPNPRAGQGFNTTTSSLSGAAWLIRSLILVLQLAVSAAAWAEVWAEVGKRPNVVLLTDDLGWADVVNHGGVIDTPWDLKNSSGIFTQIWISTPIAGKLGMIGNAIERAYWRRVYAAMVEEMDRAVEQEPGTLDTAAHVYRTESGINAVAFNL